MSMSRTLQASRGPKLERALKLKLLGMKNEKVMESYRQSFSW